MKRKERFEIYSKMLRIYFCDLFKKDNSYYGLTGRGFCWTLRKLVSEEISTELLLDTFLELKALAPKESHYGPYWYKRGAVTPRLWCLIRLFVKDFFSINGYFWNKNKE